MSKESGKSTVQWFVECDAFTNESIERELALRGIGYDSISRYPDMVGSDGKSHDVLLIPSTFVKKLKSARVNDKRFRFRFWKRNGSRGTMYPADFVEKKPISETEKFRAIAKRLSEISIAKK
ncbi:MAG: hypothetical protein GW815_03275 [Candidatus Moranbacteria bacterium]|nr:hypothetical protein [Candidatus Moranbacteria bacterium]PIX91703.1 MAG: hypothetical protein COZ27_01440 [Candidatus Moranbacteria bacterium CG_4_10_14_3_um_filter_41_65]PJC00310.1 MAG: hypothetical protein CO075_01310 [Candidatus Moranbacteria bacterium CG_4_9_14_0_8_um_filter_41_43]HCJ45865.1 hypothetical protein [Candidatus Moranbacteria bacterium]